MPSTDSTHLQDNREREEAAPQPLELLDLEGLPADEKLTATALQGLVNRSYPRVYLVHRRQEEKEGWLRELARPSVIREGISSLILAHRPDVAGLVVYDPEVPDSINVALTLSGLERGIPVGPALAERLRDRVGDLPILADLRGRFSSRIEAYRWQAATLWPRCTHDMLIGISPSAGEPPTPSGGVLQDYALAHRAMVIWLDPNLPEERALFEAILRDVSPCSPYLGWFPRDVAGEFSGTELTSAHSVYVLAADYSCNLTAFSERQVLPTASVAGSAGAAPVLENKIYVTFTMSEGDNLQYMQHRMRHLWDDPARGQAPINWTINPLALDLSPVILDYYLRTKTPQDYLIAGPSGAGYCYPGAWPLETFPSFTRQTGDRMRQLHLEAIWILNRSAGMSVPLDAASAGAYIRDVSPLGILLNYEPHTETSIVGGSLPQAITQGVSSVEDVLGALGLAGVLWDSTAPLFLSFGVLAWTMTPSDVTAIVARFTPPFQAVRGDEFFQLVRRAHGLPLPPES